MDTEFKLKADIDVKETLLSGTGWRGSAELFRIAWNAVIMLILASLLTPSDFGLVGMTDVFVQLFNILMAMGFESAVIQQEHMTLRILSSLFWLNLIIGGGLTLLSMILAPFLGWFYRRTEVVPIFAVLALSFFLQSFSVVQRGLLGRELKFRHLAVVDMGATFFSSLAAIGVALLNGGYWSLVVMQLLKYLLMGGGYWYSLPWRPSPIIDWRESWESLKFSWHLLLFNILNFFTARSDILLIGRLLGAEELGFYLLANRLVVRPVGQILTIVMRTLYPILAAMQNNRLRMRKVFMQVIYGLLALIGPFLILAGTVSPIIIPVYLGTQWLPMVPVFIVWCLGSVRRIISSRLGVLYLALGRPDLQWKYQLIVTPLVVGSLIIGVKWGALGTSISYNIAQFLMSFIGMQLVFPMLELKITSFYWYFRYLLLSLLFLGTVSGGIIFLGKKNDLSSLFIVGLAACCSLGVYGLSLYTLDMTARDGIRILQNWIMPKVGVM